MLRYTGQSQNQQALAAAPGQGAQTAPAGCGMRTSRQGKGSHSRPRAGCSWPNPNPGAARGALCKGLCHWYGGERGWDPALVAGSTAAGSWSSHTGEPRVTCVGTWGQSTLRAVPWWVLPPPQSRGCGPNHSLQDGEGAAWASRAPNGPDVSPQEQIRSLCQTTRAAPGRCPRPPDPARAPRRRQRVTTHPDDRAVGWTSRACRQRGSSPWGPLAWHCPARPWGGGGRTRSPCAGHADLFAREAGAPRPLSCFLPAVPAASRGRESSGVTAQRELPQQQDPKHGAPQHCVQPVPAQPGGCTVSPAVAMALWVTMARM
ncbi:uncharacterized protein LOC118178816 [Oxyura jamaicensis]|uniref:uncharacterized protein LOC118178816 n=1 Tax=Oxyura jamaicensis TaxID=8884 RepID=UPI0015A56DEC|nr:uncharacterized protein LOC118178816 [Oxyura jamaicensis]